jgi:hypothetical protein
MNHERVSFSSSPLALNPHELTKIEDEVKAPALGKRTEHRNAEAKRVITNGRFGDRAFLIGGEHATDATESIGWAVS